MTEGSRWLPKPNTRARPPSRQEETNVSKSTAWHFLATGKTIHNAILRHSSRQKRLGWRRLHKKRIQAPSAESTIGINPIRGERHRQPAPPSVGSLAHQKSGPFAEMSPCIGFSTRPWEESLDASNWDRRVYITSQTPRPSSKTGNPPKSQTGCPRSKIASRCQFSSSCLRSRLSLPWRPS